jgi:hypothetical protein
MLTATVGWILLIQVVITIIIFLWSYDRYAKRWSTALGRYSVEGAYSRVDYIAGQGKAQAIWSHTVIQSTVRDISVPLIVQFCQ